MSNGVRHDCVASGVCFNDAHRLKFDVFAKCWVKWSGGKLVPHNIRPSDVDFIIEQNGNVLMMEWKAHGSVFDKRSGQHILFRMITTRLPISVILCEGDAATMTVSRISVLSEGYDSGPVECSEYGLRKILRGWSKWADANKRPAVFVAPGKKPSWLDQNNS